MTTPRERLFTYLRQDLSVIQRNGLIDEYRRQVVDERGGSAMREDLCGVQMKIGSDQSVWICTLPNRHTGNLHYAATVDEQRRWTF